MWRLCLCCRRHRFWLRRAQGSGHRCPHRRRPQRGHSSPDRPGAWARLQDRENYRMEKWPQGYQDRPAVPWGPLKKCRSRPNNKVKAAPEAASFFSVCPAQRRPYATSVTSVGKPIPFRPVCRRMKRRDRRVRMVRRVVRRRIRGYLRAEYEAAMRQTIPARLARLLDLLKQDAPEAGGANG